jgi:hypothetical protein
MRPDDSDTVVFGQLGGVDVTVHVRRPGGRSILEERTIGPYPLALTQVVRLDLTAPRSVHLTFHDWTGTLLAHGWAHTEEVDQGLLVLRFDNDMVRSVTVRATHAGRPVAVTVVRLPPEPVH